MLIVERVTRDIMMLSGEKLQRITLKVAAPMDMEKAIGKRRRLAIITADGLFAIHRTISHKATFTVTNLPSRRAIYKRLNSIKQARRFIEVLKNLDIPWNNVTNSSDGGLTKDQVRTISSAINKFRWGELSDYGQDNG